MYDDYEAEDDHRVRLRVIKGTHCNLPRPESPNPKKYVSLFVQKTTKSAPFAWPLEGQMTSTVTKCPLYRPYADPPRAGHNKNPEKVKL